MTSKKSSFSETPNQYSFWSYCVALVTVFAIADVMTGGLIRESFSKHIVEYGMITFAMIATIRVFASDGSAGLKFVRACSRHKL
jgi:hypothetical protein